VTSLDDEIFVLRWKERDQLKVYDVISYRLQRRLTVPDAQGFTDLTSCDHYRCLYIGDHCAECVHRLDAEGSSATRCPVNDEPAGLSVNASRNVIVTCRVVRKIKEFSSHGDPLRELALPDDVISPWHAVQSSCGQLVVCEGDLGDPVHRVLMLSVDGRRIVHSHGGQPGSSAGQYDGPFHLAADNNGFLLVANVGNRRVTMLSPTLEYVRPVVSWDVLKWDPERLYLDVERRRLYVADNDVIDDEYIARRVVVFSL